MSALFYFILNLQHNIFLVSEQRGKFVLGVISIFGTPFFRNKDLKQTIIWRVIDHENDNQSQT